MIGTTESASKSFGVSIGTIRPLAHSLYSYMHPLGLALLPSSFDAATDLARHLSEKGAPIQAMIEMGCISFFSSVKTTAHLTPIEGGQGMYRLSAGEDAAIESVHELDVREQDLLKYTNASEDVGYAIFLCDLAASAGALSVFVVRDPYFLVKFSCVSHAFLSISLTLFLIPQKNNAAFSEYRAIPLIDTEKLLSFIDTSILAGEDDEIQYSLPFSMETLEAPQFTVNTVGVMNSGDVPSCPDFVLHSEAVQSSRAYAITISDEQQVLSARI